MTKPFCPTCKEEFEKDIRYCPNDGTAVISPQDADLQDKVFDQRYKISEKIGEGGMGAVYKAAQLSTGKNVAIKVVSSKHTQNEDTIKRFQREVKLQTKLSHPNLVSILDFSKTADGEYYFVMEFVEGKSLSRFIKERGQLLLEDFMEISSQICDGLEYAHRQGVIHRDLKGDNIIIMDIGHQLVVKVLDFGLAKAVAEQDQQITSEITQMGSALGTPAYMAPEQAMGEVNKMGPHTDIYTLGVIFYQMLAGQLPFKASTPWGLMQKHVAEPPAPVRDFNRQVPNAVSKIIMKCMEKDPDNRYSSAVGVKRDLEKTTFALQKEKNDLVESDEVTVKVTAVSKSRWFFRTILVLLMTASLAGLFFAYSNHPDTYSRQGKELMAVIVEYVFDPPKLTPPKQDTTEDLDQTSKNGEGKDDGSAGTATGEGKEPSDTSGADRTSPDKQIPSVIDEKTIVAFADLIAEANKAMEENELSKASEFLAQAEALIPNEPNLEAAKKALTERLEAIAKSISDEVGYIEAIDQKWGFIVISKIKGVTVHLGDKLYTRGKDGKVKEMVVEKLRPTKISAVTKESLDQFTERMKITRKPPTD